MTPPPPHFSHFVWCTIRNQEDNRVLVRIRMGQSTLYAQLNTYMTTSFA